jgi:hypothetical protein
MSICRLLEWREFILETVAARHLARRYSKRGFSAIVQNTDEGIAKHEFPWFNSDPSARA